MRHSTAIFGASDAFAGNEMMRFLNSRNNKPMFIMWMHHKAWVLALEQLP
jgi:hypothetical protein